MKGWILPILFFGLLGCQDVQRPEKPKNLIPKDKMVDIIAEAYLANAARNVDHRKIIASGMKLDSLIYKKYNVDSIQFAKSNAYYADEMNIYAEIFTEVEERYNGMILKMDSLSRGKLESDSTKNEQKEVKKDSLI